jgi:hypothetical protein
MITKEVATFAKKEVDTIEDMSRFKISGDVTLARSIKIRELIKAKQKEIKVTKDKMVDPIKQGLKEIMDFWKPFEERLAIVDSYMSSQQLDYRKKLVAESEKKQAEVEKKIEKGEITFEQASKKIEKVEMKVDAIPTRIQKKAKVIDKAKLPLDYLIPDMVAIRRDLLKGEKIPGAELYDEVISVRLNSIS